ncbi:MAG: trigger factor [Odoribacteraceae bacterium]|jgi:trigger factor|nr:trigger factor [Odoribacteraceae bacterium]
MNVTQETIDSLHGTIKIEVVKEDYAGKVDTALKNYQRKSTIDGFRKGKTPFGIVKKMYGKTVLMDELNKMLGERLATFIKENNLNILYEPLPAKGQQELDWNAENHDFLYDIAYVPEMNVKLSKREKIPFYTIKIDDKMIDDEIAAILNANGELTNVETVEGTEYLMGQLVELDADGQEKEEGIRNEEASMSLAHAKDDETRDCFTGATAGSRVIFNPVKAYPNKTDLAAMLGIDKARAEALTSDFAFTIGEIRHYVDAELDQTFLDKLYGPGAVNGEQEFRDKVKARLVSQLGRNSDYRFTIDARDKMFKKNEGVALPEDFLKRWLLETNERMTEENLNANLANYLEEFKWHLIKHALQQEYHVEVTEEDLLRVARQMSLSQLQQYYGPHPFTLEDVDPFAKRLLEDDKQRDKMHNMVQDEKIFAIIKENVKLEEQELTLDDFGKLFRDKK